MSNKEQIYDTEIAPLMEQILTICQDNKIAMLASFALPTEADSGLVCTSALLGGAYQAPAEWEQAVKLLKPAPVCAFTITAQPLVTQNK